MTDQSDTDQSDTGQNDTPRGAQNGTVANGTGPERTERFEIRGRVGAASFPPWIRRHGARLGLECRDLAQQEARVSLLLTGPPALLDAMEMGCSLGPWDIWVEQIDRTPLFPDAPDGAADD